MAYTLFARLMGSSANDNDTTPETSGVFYNPPMTAYHNVTLYRQGMVALDDGDTESIAVPAISGKNVLFMARVLGEAKLTSVGTDWDGTTPITAVTAGYGNQSSPGIISLVSKNLTSLTLEGLADGTTVEYIACIVVADNDSSLLT